MRFVDTSFWFRLQERRDPAQLEFLRALHHKYDDEHVGPPLKIRAERG
jgi:hypothetical protein